MATLCHQIRGPLAAELGMRRKQPQARIFGSEKFRQPLRQVVELEQPFQVSLLRIVLARRYLESVCGVVLRSSAMLLALMLVRRLMSSILRATAEAMRVITVGY